MEIQDTVVEIAPANQANPVLEETTTTTSMQPNMGGPEPYSQQPNMVQPQQTVNIINSPYTGRAGGEWILFFMNILCMAACVSWWAASGIDWVRWVSIPAFVFALISCILMMASADLPAGVAGYGMPASPVNLPCVSVARFFVVFGWMTSTMWVIASIIFWILTGTKVSCFAHVSPC